MAPDSEPHRPDAPGDAGTSLGTVDDGLPEIPDATIERIEAVVFQRIGADRGRARRRRRTAWISASAAAAVIVVAAVIAPSLQAGLTPPVVGASDSAVEDGGLTPQYSAGDSGGDAGESSAGGGVAGDADLGSEEGMSSVRDAERDIITTASVSVTVDDVKAGADAVTRLAEESGGWVESLQFGSYAEPMPIESKGAAADAAAATYGWISVRVPSGDLEATVSALSDLGEVTSVDISRQDVTEAAIDMRARIDSLKASVARLTELMAQSGSVGDLIAAETALSERQAELESYEQQLEQLEGQVDMSTLTVELAKKNVAVEADPAGFADGFVAGWNAVVATLNGIVLALGFLIPWIVILGVLGLVVWFVVWLVRRRRTRPPRPRVEPTSAEE